MTDALKGMATQDAPKPVEKPAERPAPKPVLDDKAEDKVEEPEGDFGILTREEFEKARADYLRMWPLRESELR